MPNKPLTATQMRLLRRFRLHPRFLSGFKDVCIHQSPRISFNTFKALQERGLIEPQYESKTPSQEVTWWKITHAGIEELKK